VRPLEVEFGNARPAHKRAKKEGPLPLAFTGMLELTPRPGQANADRSNYDFSLKHDPEKCAAVFRNDLTQTTT
jgi:hypothetical protein